MTDLATVTLFRPVGPAELDLIREAGWQRFPPRLPDQPIFYPVLNEEYATQIARDWNTKDGGTGYVLRFQVRKDYLDRYPVQIAGARIHQEYWIPAEDLDEFNRNLVGTIEIISRFSQPA
ncbi:MAG: hypothetical protein M9913_17595 [Bryobacteraceae bacterium]|nr:hypothetical protein [Solibacteraceae bacterium]MCO5352681.1 hypothetical protein [Bryobacteraceae bacterium]